MQLAVHNMTLKKMNINIDRTTDSSLVITPILTDAPVAIVEIKESGIQIQPTFVNNLLSIYRLFIIDLYVENFTAFPAALDWRQDRLEIIIVCKTVMFHLRHLNFHNIC